MEGTEVRKLAELEDDHWWYRERRHLLGKAIAGLVPGRALDIGAAGGGNTRVLREHGWDAVALEYGSDGAEVAHGRGLATLRGDATRLPFADGSLDLVMAFDLLEHLEDDDAAVAEVHRVLKPTGTYLVAVPADPRLWSEHDEAVDHVRRYTREGLLELLDRGGFDVTDVRSWNVLLRPVVAMRRRTSSGSDLENLHPVVNFGLRTIITAERYLPVGGLPGVSLLVRAQPRS
ncbi:MULTISPECIES: bifunctional 2-polyprenyl-6-hydroxyphenol methylase/3-demethylubiquinol 3-O-methyltransferase UbiG [unclassified Terrabacter]|jgi:SAM-dependent methyltransferase|uniref:class I SAM-dependent methyltransferase n=1 Tax=unclassified Terrabacter TaxID=2630222 RepID=UPI0006FB8E20|nr:MULTISPECIES: class I SAM-dependent methyltransferase [unclassified Terrabacter]KRB44152.1 methyltransferase [Terrabacter sp. Root181]KRF39421.1 methyltransferase [Terrabacter sp. Soil810]